MGDHASRHDYRRYFIFLILTLIVVPSLLLAADPVIKEEIRDYREHLDKTKKELSSIRDQIKKQRETLVKEKYKEKVTSKNIQKLDRAIDITRKELNVFNNNISVLESGMKDLNSRIAEAEKLKEEKRQAVMNILRKQYERKDTMYLKFLLNSGNISDFVRRYKFVKILSGKNAEQIEQYRRLIEKLSEDRQALDDYKGELVSVKQEKESEWKRYNNEKREKNTLLKSIKSNIKQRSRMLSELETNARKLTKFIDGMEATAELSDKDAARAFESSRGRFPWPVDAGYILAGFGKYKHPQFKTIVENRGIHIKEKYAAPVYSIFGGIIKYADWFEGYGKMVIVYHGGGYFSIYGHLSDIDVNKGQKVAIRQQIGKVGDTESFYGDELYFELRKKGTPVNPMSYLKKR